jgi:hypothetical protein
MRDQSEVTTFVEPILVTAPYRHWGDVGGGIDAPHLDAMKIGWPEY